MPTFVNLKVSTWSLATFSVSPPRSIFARVFSLLWAWRASLAEPCPNLRDRYGKGTRAGVKSEIKASGKEMNQESDETRQERVGVGMFNGQTTSSA